jgi:hypothetical protein
MPYWPSPPKSACRLPPPIELMYASERGSRGKFETSWFHGLFAGNTGQPPIVGDVPGLTAGAFAVTSALHGEQPSPLHARTRKPRVVPGLAASKKRVADLASFLTEKRAPGLREPTS